jgi:hypothetical protein
MAMAKTKRTRRRSKSKSGKPNYIIVGKGREVVLVSGATDEVYTLNKTQSANVLKLIRERQKLGRELTELLRREGFVLSPLGAVHLQEDDN